MELSNINTPYVQGPDQVKPNVPLNQSNPAKEIKDGKKKPALVLDALATIGVVAAGVAMKVKSGKNTGIPGFVFDKGIAHVAQTGGLTLKLPLFNFIFCLCYLE